MNTDKKYSARLSALVDSMEDQILQSSDHDILETSDENEQSEIVKVGEIINSQILSFRKDQRKQAREEYLEATQNVTIRAFNLPNDLKMKYDILTHIFQRNQNIPTELTMAFREGKDLSEADIDSLLNDLVELGILKDEDIGNKS